MLSKINRQTVLRQYPAFPQRSYNYEKDEEICSYPPVYKNYILSIPAKTFRGLASHMGTALLKLAHALDSSKLLFLGDYDIPWLQQANNYNPAKAALQYLVDNKIGQKFNGALIVDKAAIETFTKHLCWLTRCNAALPSIYFIDVEERILGTICKFGNLHLDVLDSKTDALLNKHIAGSAFQYTDACYNQFGHSGAIPGREAII